MRIKICLVSVLLFLCPTQFIFAQKNVEQRKVIICSDCGFPLNAKPIFLPKPEYPKAALMVKASGAVQVQITIDENGNVESAKAVSGHPLLQAESVKVALKSKWKPIKLSGKPIKVTGVIVFNFLPNELIQSKDSQEKYISGGIINGRATNLPKPTYPQEAKDFCASGKVEVEVLLDEDGNVTYAKAVSGDELLRDSAVEAVKKAKFKQVADGSPVKTKGIIVYNFVPEIKCIVVGIVNKKALNIPVFSIHPHIKIKRNAIVEVRVVIDMSGKVIKAKALETVPPLLRGAFEAAARSAKFSPILINGPPILVSGIIVYKLKIDGTVESNIFDKKKN